MMVTKGSAQAAVDGAFQQIALMLGGLYAMEEIDGDLVGRLVENLEAIRERVLRHLGGIDGAEGVRHPAVAAFLQRLQEGGGAS